VEGRHFLGGACGEGACCDGLLNWGIEGLGGE